MPKSLELETRVARLELLLLDLNDTVATLTKRQVALQAELDHLLARVAGL